MTTPTPREALAELVAAHDQARTLTEDAELIAWSGRIDRAWQAARAALAVPAGCLAEVQPVPEQPKSEQPQDHLAAPQASAICGGTGRDTLLPCPFCGGKAAFVPRAVNIVLQKDPSNPKFGVSVICGTCSAESANMIDEAHAAAKWNRRADDEANSPGRAA